MQPIITPRQYILAIGIVLAAIGLCGLVLPASADAESGLLGSERVACGTPIQPSVPQGLGGIECGEALDGRRVWSIPVGLLGLAVVIGAVTVYREQRPSVVNDEPLHDDTI